MKQWDVKWDHNETLVHSVKDGDKIIHSKLPSVFVPSISTYYYEIPKRAK